MLSVPVFETLPEVPTEGCAEDAVDDWVSKAVERSQASNQNAYSSLTVTGWHLAKHVKYIKQEVRAPTPNEHCKNT